MLFIFCVTSLRKAKKKKVFQKLLKHGYCATEVEKQGVTLEETAEVLYAFIVL